MLLRRLRDAITPLPPVDGGQNPFAITPLPPVGGQPASFQPATPRFMSDIDMPGAAPKMRMIEPPALQSPPNPAAIDPPDLSPVPKASDAAAMAIQSAPSVNLPDEMNRVPSGRIPQARPSSPQMPFSTDGLFGGAMRFAADRANNIRNLKDFVKQNYVNPYKVVPGMGVPVLPQNTRFEELNDEDYIERDTRYRRR